MPFYSRAFRDMKSFSRNYSRDIEESAYGATGNA